jgi:hypothetical protein
VKEQFLIRWIYFLVLCSEYKDIYVCVCVCVSIITPTFILIHHHLVLGALLTSYTCNLSIYTILLTSLPRGEREVVPEMSPQCSAFNVTLK